MRIMVIPVFILLVSCDINGSNGTKEITSNKATLTKNGVYEHMEYYSNGSIKAKYFTLKGKFHGLYTNFYSNGMICDSGQWVAGKKEGYFSYFDTLGRIEKIVEFIAYKDTSIGRPNQIIKIASNGDTVLSQSLFYEYWYVRDTLENVNQEYVFRVILPGHIFDKASLEVCDYDEYYNQLPNAICTVGEMNDFKITVALPKDKIKKGINVIRGAVVNYREFKNKDGKDTVNSVRLYFSKQFFVK